MEVIVGSTNPVNDSMNCVQQLKNLKDTVVQNLQVDSTDISVFFKNDSRRRIIRIKRDIVHSSY